MRSPCPPRRAQLSAGTAGGTLCAVLILASLLGAAARALGAGEGWQPPKAHPVAPSIVHLPSVHGPIPVTSKSWPFASAMHSVTPRDLGASGYVEEEYFVTGFANVYGWPALGRLTSFARGRYTTRILVRRPKDPARFSGTVIVEALNPSLRYDAPIMWMESQDYFIAHGDAYVGVTVKPVAIDSLKRFDRERYAALSFANPLSPALTCPASMLPPAPGGLPPESSPRTENGLIWDILSEVGLLVRSRDARNPLARFAVSRIYLTGDSQSGAFVLIYANAIHPFALRGGGKPVYDGYLTSSAQSPGVPVNQCAPAAPPGDARLIMQPRGVPIIKLVNQTDLTYLDRRADSDASPDLYRGYEIAGAAHVHDWVLMWGAAKADVAKTGAAGFLSDALCKQHGEHGNEFPTQYVLDGAWANLERWSRDRVPPPRAAPLKVQDPHHARATLVLDEFGNAVGGVRTPYVEVPLVRYGVYMDGPGICELWGYQVPLAAAVLKKLYPTSRDYLEKVQAATQVTVAERWFTPEDGRRVIQEAAAAAERMDMKRTASVRAH
jgi:hypothetical protein